MVGAVLFQLNALSWCPSALWHARMWLLLRPQTRLRRVARCAAVVLWIEKIRCGMGKVGTASGHGCRRRSCWCPVFWAVVVAAWGVLLLAGHWRCDRGRRDLLLLWLECGRW